MNIDSLKPLAPELTCRQGNIYYDSKSEFYYLAVEMAGSLRLVNLTTATLFPSASTWANMKHEFIDVTNQYSLMRTS